MNDRKNEPPWSHVYWLGVLATMESYSAAAQRLDVSKATMSYRIAELEKLAGVPLVRRTTRSVRLTEAGQHLVALTRGSFSEIERTFTAVKDLAGEPRGLLRITAPVALGRQQIVPRLAPFLHRYPEVRIEIELSDRLVSLAKEGFDLAIRHSANVPETHVVWALCETRSLLVATQPYLSRYGVPEHPADLARHNCLHYSRPGETPTWSFERVPSGEDRVTVPIKGPFAANNSEALREATLADLGVSLLPDFSAQPELANGRLLPILPDWRPVGVFAEQLYAIRPYSAYVPQPVKVFVEYLRQALSDGVFMQPGTSAAI
jgi:DNA-binding transcriptional LysR family regulator